jgi:hypothetical protein
MSITEWDIPLTKEEEKAIRDNRDNPLIRLIKNTPLEDRTLIDKSIDVKSEYQEEYKRLQIPWISDFKEFWGENHHKDPDVYPSEFSKDYLASREGERYKLFYSVHNPDKIEIKEVNEKTLSFLTEGMKIVRIVNLAYHPFNANN